MNELTIEDMIKAGTCSVLEKKKNHWAMAKFMVEHRSDGDKLMNCYEEGAGKALRLIDETRDELKEKFPEYEPTPDQVRGLAILKYRNIPDLKVLGPQIDGFLGVQFAGMFVGIEKDGYTHS